MIDGTQKELIAILSNPKYWCPSKDEQWRRMASALLEYISSNNKKDLLELINCEIDCIKSGNSLSPSEKDIAISVLNNILIRLGIKQKER
jgi:hypothetical protein